MFVKSLLVSFFLASSTLGLAPPQLYKRDVHNRHAHVVARTPVPVLASKPLGRRHARTKRCTKRPQTPDTDAPVNVQSVGSSPSTPAPIQPSTNPDPSTPSTPTDPPKQPEQPPAGGGGGRKLEGEGTYYDAGLGACGITNTNKDYIAAVSHELFDTYPGYAGPGSNPNNNPICGKTITVSYQGKSVSVIVVDRCQACKYGDVDFTPTAFAQLGDEAVGRLRGIEWEFPNPN